MDVRYFASFRSALSSGSLPWASGNPSSANVHTWPTCIPVKHRQLVNDLRCTLAKMDGVDEYQPDNCSLYRFLVSRNYDVKVTAAMYADMVRWRERFGADSVFEEKAAAKLLEGKAVLPQGVHKTDKWGHPVFYLGLDQSALAQLVKEGVGEGSRASSLEKYFVAELESFIKLRFPACSKALGNHIDSAVLIVEGSTLSLWSLDAQLREFLEGLSTTLSDNYPETLHKLFLINTPSTFKATWALVRPWLAPQTRQKIKILGKDYQEALLEDVEASDLPTFLGGTCTCEEGGGCLSSEEGPWRDPAVIQELSHPSTQHPSLKTLARQPTVMPLSPFSQDNEHLDFAVASPPHPMRRRHINRIGRTWSDPGSIAAIVLSLSNNKSSFSPAPASEDDRSPRPPPSPRPPITRHRSATSAALFGWSENAFPFVERDKAGAPGGGEKKGEWKLRGRGRPAVVLPGAELADVGEKGEYGAKSGQGYGEAPAESPAGPSPSWVESSASSRQDEVPFVHGEASRGRRRRKLKHILKKIFMGRLGGKHANRRKGMHGS